MRANPPNAPLAVRAWIVLCALCAALGWGLSIFHQLNTGAYAVACLLGVVAVFVLRKQIWPNGLSLWNWRKQRSRFRRWVPLAFLAVTVLETVGGVLYAPSNYDALAYRVPRVLHWLAEGRWHWIHTEFHRLNVRAPAIEWMSAPLMALTHSDRLLFLINVVSLCLLPGLVFSLFTRLGVRRCVAWYWMWLVPTGYCFLLQAGSIANDLFGAVFALAALDFALRAKASGRVSEVWFSILGMALLTGAKASNLPLLLPWTVAILPALPLLRAKLVPTVAIGMLALAASLAPLCVLNWKYCGDWTGTKAEDPTFLKGTSTIRAFNNGALFVLQNLTPPVFPMASQWNRAIRGAMPDGLRTRLEGCFEPAGAHWALGEMQIEEAAGLGFGVSLLLAVSVVAGIRARAKLPAKTPLFSGSLFSATLLGCVVVALLVFMIKSGMTTAARAITPYYGLLIPFGLMVGSQHVLVRTRWWRIAAAIVFALAALLIVISPSRPLWPAQWVAKGDQSQSGGLLARADAVYSVFRQRPDAFAALRQLVPPDVQLLGLVTSDDPETSLWRPYGHRRIVHVTHTDTAQTLRARGIQLIGVNTKKAETILRQKLDPWLQDINGEVVAKVTLPLRVTDGSSDWILVRLKP